MLRLLGEEKKMFSNEFRKELDKEVDRIMVKEKDPEIEYIMDEIKELKEEIEMLKASMNGIKVGYITR